MAFAESVAGGNNNSLGPVTLRKSSAPLNALFMNEITRSSVPIPMLSATSGGRSVQVDLSQFDGNHHELNEAHRNSMLPSQSLQLQQQPQQRPLSLFIPSRPDDINSSSASANGAIAQANALNASVGGIARPDLIGTAGKSKNPNGSGSGGGGGAVGGGTGGGLKSPPTYPMKGPAATLMSDVNRRPSGTGGGVDPNRGRTSSGTNFGSGSSGNNASGGPQRSVSVADDKKAPTSPSMLRSMTNFFTGGKG